MLRTQVVTFFFCLSLGFATGCGDGSSTITDPPPSDASSDATSMMRDGSLVDGPAVDAPNDMQVGVPGIVVSPTSGLTTTEMGGTAEFTVRLATQPSADVVVALTNGDPSEGTATPTSLTFTSLNWNAPQTVTVQGVDDADFDGNQTYTVATNPAVSTDAVYSDVNADDVTLQNIDDETAQALIESSRLATTEDGDTATFTIRLSGAPTADVSLGLSSSDETEATVSPSSLTFTAENWNSGQVVTVTGVDDTSADGPQAFTIITEALSSSDARFDGVAVDDVSGTNGDNDLPGILAAVMGSSATTEAGGTVVIRVRLRSAPTDTVTLPATSSDTTEGSVDEPILVFTTDNWDSEQVLTVAGVDDFGADGNQEFSISFGPATSTDTNYEGLTGDPIVLTNSDDETAGLTITPATSLSTNESGASATFTVQLASQPMGNVSVSVASADETEGLVSPSSLTFTAANWNTPQNVSVSGVEDAASDGPQDYSVVLHVVMATSDADYAALSDTHIPVTNADNDTAGVTVSPVTGLTVSESGATGTFGIVLNTIPSSTVTISLSSDSLADGTVSPSSVTFSPANWNVQQTVTVSPINDSIDDGDHLFNIVTAASTSSDPSYNGLSVADVAVTNLDDDSVGVMLSGTMGTLVEGGDSAAILVHLTSEPLATVTIPLHVSDSAQATVTPASLTFTTSNWIANQVVTIAAVNDTLVDGTANIVVSLDAASSSDPLYNGFNPDDAAFAITDNDTASVIVTPTSGLMTAESGGTATFTLVLSATPSSSVSIALSSSNAAEGSVAPSTVTFTGANWNVPQTVTVTGVDDAALDGTVSYSVVTSATSSADAAFSGLVVSDVSVSNSDNDVAGVTISPTSGLTTSESGASTTFTIRLNAMPSSDVTLYLGTTILLEGQPLTTSLIFTPSDWNVPRTVTVAGNNDSAIDGPQNYGITFAVAPGSNAGYLGLSIPNLTITNLDNDGASLSLTQMAGLITTEAGGTATFQAILGAMPMANVTISLSSSNTAEGTVSPSMLTFTPSNWNTYQVVTITGVNDALLDGDVAYQIVTGAMVSTDANFNGVACPDVSVTNRDNDTPGVTVSSTAAAGVSEAGSTTTFTVVLVAAPTSDVTIPLLSTDVGEVTVSPSSLTFTPANWSTPQTVTLTGVGDATLDGDQTITIALQPATGASPGYNGLDASDVSVVVGDMEPQRLVSGDTKYVPATGTLAANYNRGVSDNGRYVVFTSNNATIVAGDTNGQTDVFLRDRVLGTTTRVNVTSAGAQTTGAIGSATMSGDGRYIVYDSAATTLAASDTNGLADCFMYDRMTATTTRVSVSNTGAQLDGACSFANVTNDGRYVAFLSGATNAVATDTNGVVDVFVRDTVANTTVIASLANSGSQITSAATTSYIAAGGRYVAFVTTAQATSSDTDAVADVYVRDLMLATSTRISVNSTGGNCDGAAGSPTMSTDGRYVLFSSLATNVVAGDTNAVRDIYVRDTMTGVTARASLGNSNVQGTAQSRGGNMSDDGRYVIFITASDNMIVGDNNGNDDLLLRDMVNNTTRRVSLTYSGAQIPSGILNQPGNISADGTTICYSHQSSTIMFLDANGSPDTICVPNT